MKPVYLLTGNPGTGKTSLIKQVVAEFRVKAGGFYTEEIRRHGTRLGFRLVTLDGREAVLAHTDFSKRFQVGKYGVDIGVMDSVAVPALRHAAGECDLVVIDEIGKMELFSSSFREAVSEIIGSGRSFREAVSEIIGSGKRVLGTVMLHAHPWADAIKKQPQVQLVTVTRAGYDKVLDDLRGWLGATVSPPSNLVKDV